MTRKHHDTRKTMAQRRIFVNGGERVMWFCAGAPYAGDYQMGCEG